MKKILLCALVGLTFASNVYACPNKEHKPATPTAPAPATPAAPAK